MGDAADASVPVTTLTASALNTLQDAVMWAAIRRPHHTTSLHLLLGLVHQHNSIAAEVLADNDISDINVWSAIDYWDPPRSGANRAPRLLRLRPSPTWKSSAKRVVAHAAIETAERGGCAVDTGDLLMALLHEPGSRASRILDRSQLDAETLRQLVKSARAEIEEGRGTETIPNLDHKRPVRPNFDSLDNH